MSEFQHPEKALDIIFSHRTLKTLTPGVLTVSAYPHFFPVCYKKKNGELAGLDVDVMVHFAKVCGLEVQFIERDAWEGIWLDPVQGLSDISIGGIGMSKKRARVNTAWTIPYFYVQRTLVFNLKEPIDSFPAGVSAQRTLLGTPGSTGWIDAQVRLKANKPDLSKSLVSGTTGQVQGLMRGSFVGRAIVEKYPTKLGMVEPWTIDPSLVTSDGEVFAYPCHVRSGVSVLLSAFLTEEMMNHELEHLIRHYNLDCANCTSAAPSVKTARGSPASPASPSSRLFAPPSPSAATAAAAAATRGRGKSAKASSRTRSPSAGRRRRN
jgi:hypothetical protein